MTRGAGIKPATSRAHATREVSEALINELPAHFDRGGHGRVRHRGCGSRHADLRGQPERPPTSYLSTERARCLSPRLRVHLGPLPSSAGWPPPVPVARLTPAHAILKTLRPSPATSSTTRKVRARLAAQPPRGLPVPAVHRSDAKGVASGEAVRLLEFREEHKPTAPRGGHGVTRTKSRASSGV